MPTINPADAPSWSKWVTDFDNAVAQVNTQYQNLLGLAPIARAQGAAVFSAYNDVLTRGVQHLTALNQLRAQRDSIANWLSQVGSQLATDPLSALLNPIKGAVQAGENAAGNFFNWVTGKSPSLGAVPIIAIAVTLVAASAVIVAAINWAREADQETRRLQAMQTLMSQGKTPDQAAALVSQTLGPVGSSGGDFLSIFGLNTTSIIPLALGGLALLVFLKKRA